jgi:hypothetical protein
MRQQDVLWSMQLLAACERLLLNYLTIPAQTQPVRLSLPAFKPCPACAACLVCPLLQDPELAMQTLSRALLALSMSYDCAFFLLELGDRLLQRILRSSTNLQGLARAAGVKLQLLACFSAANTQVCASVLTAPAHLSLCSFQH